MFLSLFNALVRRVLCPVASGRNFRRLAGSYGMKWRPLVEPLDSRCLPSGGVSEYPIPTPMSDASFITVGPDGNVWFTEHDGDNIGKITPDGTITEFPIPVGSHPNGITAGPDGQIWFTERSTSKIGRMTVAGDVTGEFSVSPGCQPAEIVAGPDNRLWFVEYSCPAVGAITTDGVVTEYSIPAGTGRTFITSGPDARIWFTEDNYKIGAITTGGAFTPYTLPIDSQNLRGITTGPDGKLWVTGYQNANRIGQVDTSGNLVQQVRVSDVPYGIIAGPDGNLWFTLGLSKIGRITTSGIVSEFSVPTANSAPDTITVGPDGNIWFTEEYGNQIGKLHVLSATGVTLGEAITAGQPLDAVVATFHDDEPGMLGSNYQVDIDWGDGTSSGQAWTAGGGNWVATGSHTYADPGHYDIAVTITDTHAPTGMTATAYSSVDVDPAANSGNRGRRAGFEAFADVASALATTPQPATRLTVMPPAAGVPLPVARPADESPAQPLQSRSENGSLAVAGDALRHDTGAVAWAEPPAWLDLADLDLLARNLLA